MISLIEYILRLLVTFELIEKNNNDLSHLEIYDNDYSKSIRHPMLKVNQMAN